MELDMRKLSILRAIIDDYILTAAPVGSRTVSKHSQIGLSSATIRNEMADLEELGYLEQPHTSAGRIPSDKAYRLYVNDMMHRSKLTDAEMKYIQQYFSGAIDDVEDIVKQTAWILSSITKYTSMVMTPQLHAIKVKHIQLVPIGDSKALAVIVTDAGITRDSVIRIPRDMDALQLEKLSRILTSRLSNSRLDEIKTVLIPELNAEISEHRAFLNSIVEALQRRLGAGKERVELSGATNMLSYPEYSDMSKARSFLSAMEEKDALYRMLKEATKVEFSVTIGSENSEPDMKECSIVTATYKVSDSTIGSMGVIGPTRMDYSRVLALLGFIGRSLSDVFTNMLEEENK